MSFIAVLCVVYWQNLFSEDLFFWRYLWSYPFFPYTNFKASDSFGHDATHFPHRMHSAELGFFTGSTSIGHMLWHFPHETQVFYCIPYGKYWLYSVVRRLLQVDTWLYRRTGRQTGRRLKLWSKYMLSQKTALPVLRVTPGAYLKVEFHLPAFLPGLQNCFHLPL